MATSYQTRTSSKTLFKIILGVAVVIFIVGKLLNDSIFRQSESSTVDEAFNGNIQSFREKVAPESLKLAHDIVHMEKANDQVPAVREDRRNWLWNMTSDLPKDAINVMISLANAKFNTDLQTKFRTCVTSMSELSSAQILLIVAGDKESRGVAETVVAGLRKKNVQLRHVDVDILGEEMKETINTLQQHFSYKPGTYYSHTLFFLSTAIHRLAPPTLHRLIMLDADLRFHADITLLHAFFDKFSDTNIIGIAHENQPVYRHVLSVYRQAHPGTRAGDPAPKGLPGFNSGVLLMDLDRMRTSQRYNALLDSSVVKGLAEKYSYKGHLGDQDFYSLVSLENEDLFFVLPCTWNRQLCKWWRDKGYEDVFDSYFACSGKINIYHGNCNTPFPNE